MIADDFMLDILIKLLIAGTPFALIGGLYYATVRKKKIANEANKLGVDAAAVLSNEALAWIKEAREMATNANIRIEVMEERVRECERELDATKYKIRMLERDKVSLLRLVRALSRYVSILHEVANENGHEYPLPPEDVKLAIQRYHLEEE